MIELEVAADLGSPRIMELAVTAELGTSESDVGTLPAADTRLTKSTPMWWLSPWDTRDDVAEEGNEGTRSSSGAEKDAAGY